MEGVSFSAPTSLLWHRALTLPRPAARSLQAKPRTAISASNGLPAGTRQLERSSDDGITAQGTVTQSQTPGATSVPIVDSARSEFIDEGVTTRATGKMERTGAPSGVLRAASSPSIQVFDRRHEAGMTHDRALASSTAGIIRKSGDGAPSPHVQRRHSYEIKPARTTEEISPRLPQNPNAPVGIEANHPNMVAKRPGSQPPAAGQVQMGPPIFRRQLRGAPLTTPQNTASPEQRRVHDASDVTRPTEPSRSESLPVSKQLLQRKDERARSVIDSETADGRPQLQNRPRIATADAANEVPRQEGTLEQLPELTVRRERKLVGSPQVEVVKPEALVETPVSSRASRPESVLLSRSPSREENLPREQHIQRGLVGGNRPPTHSIHLSRAATEVARTAIPVASQTAYDRANNTPVAERVPVSRPIDGSAAPPFIHRNEIGTPSVPSEGSSMDIVTTNVTHPMDSQVTPTAQSSSMSGDTPVSIVPPAVSNAETGLTQAGDTRLVASDAIRSIQSPVQSVQRLVQRHRKTPFADESESTPSAQAAGGTPEVQHGLVRSSAGEFEPVFHANRNIQRSSGSALGSAFGSEMLTADSMQGSGVEARQPAREVLIAPESASASTAHLQRSTFDQPLESMPAKFSQSPIAERTVSGNSPAASAVLRRAAQSSRASTSLGYSASASSPHPGLTKSEITHRLWRKTDLALAQLQASHGQINQHASHSPGNFTVVQRSATNSTGSTGVQAPPTLPNLPEQSNPMSQKQPVADITQLTDRVYEMLVRRLASEKQRRGL